MSYNDTPHYRAETFLKNRLDALLKPIVGRLYGRNAPGYLSDDISVIFIMESYRRERPVYTLSYWPLRNNGTKKHGKKMKRPEKRLVEPKE